MSMRAMLLAAALAGSAAAFDCPTSIDGTSFDLKRLSTTTDYTFNDGDPSGYNYKMNICAPVNNAAGCGDKGGAVCQFNNKPAPPAPPDLEAIVAGWNIAPYPTFSCIGGDCTKGVQAKFVNGDKCYINNQWADRTALLNMQCGSGTPTTFTLSEDKSTCTFTINISGSGGCPGGGMSGGTIFIIILIVVTAVYLVVGGALEFRKGSRGTDLMPNKLFWLGLPGLVKDGCGFVKGKLTGKSGSSGYDEV